jgi:hypothetical protein
MKTLPIDIAKEILKTYKSRKRKMIDKERIWFKIYYDLERQYGFLYGKGANSYISSCPDKYESILCFCDKKVAINKTHIHITNISCKKAKICFCIDCNTLEIKEHRLGECPHAKYIEMIQ